MVLVPDPDHVAYGHGADTVNVLRFPELLESVVTVVVYGVLDNLVTADLIGLARFAVPHLMELFGLVAAATVPLTPHLLQINWFLQFKFPDFPVQVLELGQLQVRYFRFGGVEFVEKSRCRASVLLIPVQVVDYRFHYRFSPRFLNEIFCPN
jgi:hypothetical protein